MWINIFYDGSVDDDLLVYGVVVLFEVKDFFYVKEVGVFRRLSSVCSIYDIVLLFYFLEWNGFFIKFFRWFII